MPVKTFLEKCRETMRLKHFSYRTEQTYLPVIERHLAFYGKDASPGPGCGRDPGLPQPPRRGAERGRVHLERRIQRPEFLYRNVLHLELLAIGEAERAQKSARLPEVFTREEARAVLAQMEGVRGLMARWLYGTGLRAGTRGRRVSA
jgi:integrase